MFHIAVLQDVYVCVHMCFCICSVIMCLTLISQVTLKYVPCCRVKPPFSPSLLVSFTQLSLFSTLSIITLNSVCLGFYCCCFTFGLFVGAIQEKSYIHIKLILGSYNHKIAHRDPVITLIIPYQLQK